jgi:hypothetical protein
MEAIKMDLKSECPCMIGAFDTGKQAPLALDKEQDMLSPLPVQNPVEQTLIRTTRRLRAASVRRIWCQAKGLASSFSTLEFHQMMQRWFAPHFRHYLGGNYITEKAKPSFSKQAYVRDLIWLVEIRHHFHQQANIPQVIQTNALIWWIIKQVKTPRPKAAKCGYKISDNR